jgi:hypothetical protein
LDSTEKARRLKEHPGKYTIPQSHWGCYYKSQSACSGRTYLNSWK